MKKSFSLLTAAVLALPAPVWADVHAYVNMPLTASQEVTAPATSGYGSVTALYDTATKALMYSAVYQLNAGATATAAHFHGAAALGASASVQIGLPTQPTGNAGALTGTVTLTDAQETDLLAGRWYFNIHSNLATGGELRAQMLENGTALQMPVYRDGTLNLPVVLIPGISGPVSYSANFSYPGTGNVFTLTGGAALR